jgi:hypothetical protein
MSTSGNKWRGAAVLGSIAVLGCSSEAAEPSKAPVYESASNFSGPGTGSVVEPGIGEDYPSNNPLYSRSPSRFAAVVGERLVVFPGADYTAPLPFRATRGVLVYSLEDRAAPELVAELPVEGSALQMLPGAEHVTVVARVPRQLELTEIPTTPMFNDATMLMHLDLSDPSDPQLLASTELAGELWQVVEQDGYLFVLSQVRRPDGQECQIYETSSAATTETMRVTSYRFDGSSYALVDEEDLPGDGYAAFATGSAFVSVLGNYDGDPTLSVASFGSSGEIAVSAPVAVAGAVTAVSLSGTSLAVATQAADGAQLTLFDASALSALTEQWSQPLPRAAYRLSQTELLSEPVILGSGWLLRGDGTQAPLPAGMNAYQLFAASTDSLLAMERDAGGKVLLSSWSVTAPFALAPVSQLATEWPAVEDDDSGNQGPFAWEATTQTLYYSFSVLDAQNASGVASYVGLAGLAGGTLQALGDVRLSDGGLPLVDPQGAHFVGSNGVQSVTVAPEPSAGPYLPFFGSAVERIIDRRETEVGEFVLVQRGGDVVLQYPTAEAGNRREETLPHFASELVVEGGGITAAGLYWNQDCGRDLDVPELDLECPVPRQRGITFVSLSEPPGDPRTLTIDDSLNAPSLPDDTEQNTSWFGYVRHDGRLLLPVTRLIRCHTAEVCDSLGFPWYRSFGVPGCNPDVEDCETKSFEPMQSVEGYGRESLLYALDPASAERFDDPVAFADEVDFQHTLIMPQHELGAPLDLSGAILRAGNVLGFPTDAPVYNAEGNSATNEHDEALHRFGVELVRAGEGAVTLEASINTPGRVVALADEGATVYSLAPSHLDADHITALLQRLKVTDNGATIQRTLDLGVGFRDAFASRASIHFVFGPEAYCNGASAQRESTFFSVNVETFARGRDLTLPWDSWSFNRSAERSATPSVLLNGGPAGFRGRAEIDVSGAEPEVARYFTIAP